MKSVNVHAPVQERILVADTFRVNRDGSSSVSFVVLQFSLVTIRRLSFFTDSLIIQSILMFFSALYWLSFASNT